MKVSKNSQRVAPMMSTLRLKVTVMAQAARNRSAPVAF